jgi:amino acid transporter
MSERMNAGILLAAVGAVALFISLFLNWYEPDVTAWAVFEIVDVLLAVIAAFVVLVAALQFAGRRLDFDEDRWLPLIAAAALLLVVVSIVNNPPAAFGLSEDVGAWIALAGAILIGVGAILAPRRISVVISSSPRERPARPTGPVTDPLGSEDETRPNNPVGRG